MKLSIIGTGYVGLVTGACFAEMGNTVICVDSNAAKVAALRAGQIPISEPGLPELVAENLRAGRLHFTTSLDEALSATTIHFIAVGTPPEEDGSADLTHVLEVARGIGRHMRAECIVVTKSTVPVGTADRVRAAIEEQLSFRGVHVNFDVVSNPEFLKEGDAVNDFMRPERIIVGSPSPRALDTLRALYAPFTRNHERLLVMGVRDAEMTKYAANAMLAVRISFMNEIASLCEKVGVDVEHVRRGIGSDSRIGHAFLYPGCGYGGSCFPKDMRALVHMAARSGVEAGILRAADARNRAQKHLLFDKIHEHFDGQLAGRVIGLWGLSFKPGTDDLREAPSLVLIERLLNANAGVRAYDPIAMDNARRSFPAAWLRSDKLELVDQQYDAPAGADALALVTEWKPFRRPDFDTLKQVMASPVIFDGRNQYDPQQVRAAGFKYIGIGR
ncbi:MAG: UDP-glucose 6-dehydrogenase [Burkholderiales bacterium]|jgi:UDPglucose 6-dehydrogenase|nr:UDP-glucose 6-dehydrogenase [Burkholderiales bacterium]